MSQPSFVSHKETIANLSFVSKSSSFVSSREKQNQEPITKSAHRARAKKAARSGAQAGENGEAELGARAKQPASSAAEKTKRLIQEITAEAGCSVEDYSQRLNHDGQITLRHAWQRDPDAARHTPEFRALTERR